MKKILVIVLAVVTAASSAFIIAVKHNKREARETMSAVGAVREAADYSKIKKIGSFTRESDEADSADEYEGTGTFWYTVVGSDNEEEETEAEKNVSVKTVSWKEEAEKYIYNLPEYADFNRVGLSDYLSFELIDMNGDSIPEILTFATSSGGGGTDCTSYAYFNGKNYVVDYFDGEDSPTSWIIPYKDRLTDSVVYISSMPDEDTFIDDADSVSYSSPAYWRNRWHQDTWTFNGKHLSLTETVNIEDVEGFNVLFSSDSEAEERQAALESMREYNDSLHSRYKSETIGYYQSDSFQILSVSISNNFLSAYHKVISSEFACGAVDSYVNSICR